METICRSQNSVQFSGKSEKYKGLEVQKLQRQCLGRNPAGPPSPSVSYEQIQVMSRWQQLQMHKTTLSHPLPSLFVFVICKQFEGAFQKHTVEKSHIHRCLCSFCLHHLIRLAICHSTTCIYKTTRKWFITKHSVFILVKLVPNIERGVLGTNVNTWTISPILLTLKQEFSTIRHQFFLHIHVLHLH